MKEAKVSVAGGSTSYLSACSVPSAHRYEAHSHREGNQTLSLGLVVSKLQALQGRGPGFILWTFFFFVNKAARTICKGNCPDLGMRGSAENARLQIPHVSTVYLLCLTFLFEMSVEKQTTSVGDFLFRHWCLKVLAFSRGKSRLESRTQSPVLLSQAPLPMSLQFSQPSSQPQLNCRRYFSALRNPISSPSKGYSPLIFAHGQSSHSSHLSKSVASFATESPFSFLPPHMCFPLPWARNTSHFVHCVSFLSWQNIWHNQLGRRKICNLAVSEDSAHHSAEGIVGGYGHMCAHAWGGQRTAVHPHTYR